MPTTVVPFRGAGGKRRLAPLGDEERTRLRRAMLEDVLAACRQVGPTVVADAPGGQGAAVAATLGSLPGGPVLVVNSDVPCVTPRDLQALAASVPVGGFSFVAAADGTTNALALSSPDCFQPLYGPGSAERFAARGGLPLPLPNLAADVDSLADLQRLDGRLGEHTSRALHALGIFSPQ